MTRETIYSIAYRPHELDTLDYPKASLVMEVDNSLQFIPYSLFFTV